MDFQLLLTFVTLFCVPGALLNGCGNTDSVLGAFSLTVNSRRNSTGHRRVTAVVNIPEATRRFWMLPDDLGVEVAQKTFVGSGQRGVQLTASFVVLDDERRPPPGYELVPGLGWYRLHLTPLTWEEARLACEKEGAHLAVLNSQEEANALKSIFNKAPKTIINATFSDVAFIGYSDVVAEGNYITIFGNSLHEAGYSTWGSGQPNNLPSDTDPDQDCGGFERDSGKLNDLQCRGRMPYFCEHGL